MNTILYIILLLALNVLAVMGVIELFLWIVRQSIRQAFKEIREEQALRR